MSELFSETGQSTLGIDESYNTDGTVANVTYYNGTSVVATTDYGYDDYGDVTSIVQTNASGDVLGDYTYSYYTNYATSGDDLPGLTLPSNTPSGTAAILAAFLEPPQPSASVLSETDNGTTTNYGYDGSGQLVSEGNTTQSYDLNGNRIGPSYVIGPDNQLLSDGTYNYTYDADGNEATKTNIATGDKWTYGYNNADQLVSAVETTAGGTVETQVLIQYDVFGNRLQEQVWTQAMGWTTTRYAYDAWDPATPSGVGNENWKVWATLDGSNNLVTRYINGDALDQVFAQISAGSGVAWYLTDRLGSTRELVDNNGNVLDAITYNAWGEITSQTNPSWQPSVLFAGVIFDPALGLYLNGEREYDPEKEQFIEQDPTQFRAGDSNLYRYVGNDPTNETDPSGLKGDPPARVEPDRPVDLEKVKEGANCNCAGLAFRDYKYWSKKDVEKVLKEKGKKADLNDKTPDGHIKVIYYKIYALKVIENGKWTGSILMDEYHIVGMAGNGKNAVSKNGRGPMEGPGPIDSFPPNQPYPPPKVPPGVTLEPLYTKEVYIIPDPNKKK